MEKTKTQLDREMLILPSKQQPRGGVRKKKKKERKKNFETTN